MNRKIISLLTALLLCLTLFPVQALAEEGEGTSQVVDSGAVPTVGTSQVADSGMPPPMAKARMMRAAANDTINMDYANFVFAQGVPIVIRQNGGITSIYSADDPNGVPLSGETDVSAYSVYGGWFDGSETHTADTSVVMESGTVRELFGGSFSGTLNGNTTIIVESGTITNALCGGGNSSTLNGNTNVIVNNTTVDYLYGGGFGATVNGSTTVVINNGTTVTGNAFGGSNGAFVESSKMVLNGGSASQILGGGYGENSSVANSCVELNGGSCDAAYGGGMDGSEITESTAVTVNGGKVVIVYGGGFYGAVSGSTAVTVNRDVAGSVYGGGQGAAVNGDTNVEVNGGTMSFVYSGGDNGAVTGSASVTINDGAQIKAAVYGGSVSSSVENTKVVLNGGAAAGIYGGGSSGGSVTNVSVELKGGNCPVTCGGGQSGCNVERTTITLGIDWGGKIYAGGEVNDSYNNETGISEIIVQNYKPVSQPTNFAIMSSTEKDSRIIIRESTGGPYNTANPGNFNLAPQHIKNIAVEYGTVTLLGKEGENLSLDSLDIQANGHVRIQDWDTAVIQKLSGSGGQLLFPAQFTTAGDIVNKPVTVGEISTAAPLIIKIEGTGWTEEKLKQHDFFRGSGIDALTSTNCFFSENYDVLLQEIPNEGGAKGIYLRPKKAEESVYISKLEFNENPVTYNDTISLTVGVGKQLATVDRLELIPNARIQIRGSNRSDALFADIRVSSDGKTATVTGMDGVTRPAQVDGGYITIDLPVDAALLDTCKEGLYMLAAAPDQYSSTAQLIGPNGESEIKITPAPITLTKTIPEPAFGDPLQNDLEEGPFYTASVRWCPITGGSGAFQVNRDYQADIVLTPKAGHRLSAASISSTVNYNGKAIPCVFNTDGTVTLKNLKTVRFEGYTVTVIASPREGGTVTGGGTYLSGCQATIKAEPAQGWHFVGWEENGKEIANTIEYRFSVTNYRSITAVFKEEPEGVETKLEIQEGISEVPTAFKDLEQLNTTEKITLAMRTAITQTGIPSQNTVVYDVKLMVSTDGGVTWIPATKDNFPAGGLKVLLPYPQGTDSSYTFTVVHMFTTSDFGKTPGDTEKPSVTNTAGGLQFTVNGLSPISIGWVKTGGGTTSGGNDDSSDDRNDEYDFWQWVRQKIEAAKPGDTVRANAGSYDKMPWTVMEALKKSNHITLVIRWSDGADIVIPSEKALSEALRIYYPLAYLAGYDFGIITDPSKQNPETGGIWEIDAPITAQAPLTSAGTPEITDARRGLAETPELAGQGVEKAIPGVYEPTANATPAESPVQSGERGSFSVMAVFLLAALLGLFWTWRKKGNESHKE